jgi:pectin methylesterase-like acyl-CoA thioesterase
MSNILFSIPYTPIGVGTTIRFVSKQGNDSTAIAGRMDKSYLTIQAAINASASDDTIVVFAGTYNESLTINTKYLTINFIGKVILNGNISYINTSGLSGLRQVLYGEDAQINGYIDVGTYAQRTYHFITLYKIANGGSFAFNHSGTTRSTIDAKVKIIEASYLYNAHSDNQNIYNNNDRIETDFSGIGISSSQTIGVTFINCRFYVTGYLAYPRTDFGTEMITNLHFINCYVKSSHTAIFGSSYQGYYYVKMDNCTFVGTFQKFHVDTFTGGRMMSYYLKNCDFRLATFSLGLINVTDTSGYANWQMLIDKCNFAVGTLIYQVGSATPPTAGYEYLNYSTY